MNATKSRTTLPPPVVQSSYGVPLGRKRLKNLGLPPHMQKKGASYYYVFNAKWTPLGRDLSKAKLQWAELENGGPSLKVGELVQRHLNSADNLSEGTRRQYASYQRALTVAFPVSAPTLRAQHVALWRDANKHRKDYVNGCLALLNATWRKGREWGFVEADVSVKQFDTLGRDRYLTDKEFSDIRSHAKPWLQVLMDLAYLTGARPGDVRALRWEQFGIGLSVRQQKTKHRQVFTVTDELREVLERAKSRPILGLYVIATDRGRPITKDRLDYAWQAACEAAGVSNAQVRDIRAKAGTDADADSQDAQALLGHTTRAMTEHYIRRRKTIHVEPVRLKVK